MADEKSQPVEPMTDEAIDNLVRFVEAAELFAKTMGIKTAAEATYMMLKSTQTMARVQAGRSFDGLFSSLGKKTVQ